jgi:DNA-binding transcriptional MerR regulator
VSRATGLSWRRLDYYERMGLIESSVKEASGSGSWRLYSFTDIVLLRVIKKSLDAGLSLGKVRPLIDHLRACDDMRVSIITDGQKVREFTDLDAISTIVDVGPRFFAIKVGVAWQEMEDALGLVKA